MKPINNAVFYEAFCLYSGKSRYTYSSNYVGGTLSSMWFKLGPIFPELTGISRANLYKAWWEKI